MSNFSFSHSVSYLVGELSAIFIKFVIVFREIIQVGKVKFVVWERVKSRSIPLLKILLAANFLF